MRTTHLKTATNQKMPLTDRQSNMTPTAIAKAIETAFKMNTGCLLVRSVENIHSAIDKGRRITRNDWLMRISCSAGFMAAM